MKISSLLFLLFASSSLLAQENYISNPAALYPPGCATLTEFENDAVQGEIEVISNGVIRLTDVSDFLIGGAKSGVRIRIFRQGCAEPGRSIIKLEMEVVSGGSALAPAVFAVIDEEQYPLRLATDPNSYTDIYSSYPLFQGSPLTFFLDGPWWPDLEAMMEADGPILTPEQYNGNFQIDFVDTLDFTAWSGPVPAYENNLQSQMMPFNGRLSGNWVVSGVPDQGFVIAFEELPDGTNFVFLSWYTFDQDGNLLWLTAGDSYEVGDSEIDLPIELVSNGEFLGSGAADRSVVGSANLQAIHCNNLQFAYDLSSLGLGSGTVTLQRIFSLETAGYACRDQIERADTIND
jgi:hypothetical protein